MGGKGGRGGDGRGFGGATEVALDGLGGGEDFVGSEGGVEEDGGVEVEVGRGVAPRLGLDEGGGTDKATYLAGE